MCIPLWLGILTSFTQHEMSYSAYMQNFLKDFWMSVKFCFFFVSFYSINAVTEDVYNPIVTFGVSLLTCESQ